MLIQSFVNLQAKNTLAVPAIAEFYTEVTSLAELREALAWAQNIQLPIWIVGGGSNILCADNIQGLVINIQIMGRRLLAEAGDTIQVELAAGENWHQAVCWSLQQQWYGLENLALIPGTVGAAPIQNIGAYGVEVGQRLLSVTALNIYTGTLDVLTRADCELGYRDSIFKQRLKHSHVIVGIVLQLQRTPVVTLDYPALRQAMEDTTAAITPEQVFQTVCQVRQSKLPDPATLPNCGSFFKNPVVSAEQFSRLFAAHPHIPHYPAGDNHKLAAAWLIEQAGWRGREYLGVKIHPQQALVLTNPERQHAAVILQVARAITADVQNRFQISLEMEPQILGKFPQIF